jgi:GT2 family glycosyltransferase
LIDDRRSKDCIEELLHTLEKDDEIELAYGDCFVTDEPNETFENNSSGGRIFEHSSFEFSRENMIKCLPGPVPLWRRRVHEISGFFDSENCDYADDWEMWLRTVRAGAKFKKVNKTLGLYLSGGRSQQNDPKQRREEALLFYRYSDVFGENFSTFKPYFDQFLESK